MSTRALGTPHVHHRQTDSTNERAKALATAGAAHGTLVTAEEQTTGRGRGGREWAAPRGRSLLMSLVLRRLDEDQAMLPLAAAVAVCEACESCAAVSCRVKWPNDVWIEGRKVAGILIEGRPGEDWAVLGVGLNAATRPEELPPGLRDTAASLGLPDAAPALPALLRTLESRLTAPARAVLAAWRERDALEGHPVRWAQGEGVAAGIDDSGSLLVEAEEGRVALRAGEVHLLR